MLAFLCVLLYSLCPIICDATSLLDSLLDRRLSNHSVTTRKQCQDYQLELRRLLDNGVQISVEQFNVLFHGLNKCCWHKSPQNMVTRLTVYQWMIEAEVIPDIRTFNLLIRSFRYMRPLQFQYIQYFLDEMVKFNVDWNIGTIEQILVLCALNPDSSNVRSADTWFYDVYMRRQWMGKRVSQPVPYVNHIIVSSYLNVYVAAGDVDGAHLIKLWVITHYGHLWSARTMRVFLRLFCRAFKDY